MMINFLSPHMQPSVTSNAILDDDYLPDNLISKDVRKSNMGFMAYYVVKPPINLDFHLVCHIDLHYINIWSRVNSLKSTGFEVYVKNSGDEEFVKIGSCNKLDEDGAVFIQHSSTNEAQLHPNMKILNFFRATNRMTRHVKTIRIRITETTRCVPVLKKIEVWGYVSKKGNPVDQRKAFELCNGESVSTPVAPVRSDEPPPYNMQTALDEVPIPEEFLDSITYELMAMPISLPSGKNIDRLTLEKHSQQEEKWGRAPTDPYTGLCFTTGRKPVFNAALKVQIDKFLLDNSNLAQFSNVPRTVGTVTRIPKRTHAVSGSYCHATASYELYQDAKRTRTAAEKLGAHDQSALIKRTSNLSASLEEAVQSALKNITRYTRRDDSATQSDVSNCLHCAKSNNESILYKIRNCSHLICITCLTNVNIRTCSCGKPFTNIDVERFHTSML